VVATGISGRIELDHDMVEVAENRNNLSKKVQSLAVWSTNLHSMIIILQRQCWKH